jgi:methylmalonyl-CoA/ethylmalonyl-CoA epimerase
MVKINGKFQHKIQRLVVFVSNAKLAQKVLNERGNFAAAINFSQFAKTFKCLVMQQIEHIGIAVKSLVQSIPLFEKLLNTPCYKTETVENEKVNTAFFKTGENKIELLASTSPDGVIARFIEKKGEGVHHIAFAVEDIEKEMERLKKEGFVLLSEKPKPGADNKLVCFLHPKHTNGVLIELCMSAGTLPEEKK